MPHWIVHVSSLAGMLPRFGSKGGDALDLPAFSYSGALALGVFSFAVSAFCNVLRVQKRLRLHALHAAWWERQINLAHDASARELHALHEQCECDVRRIGRSVADDEPREKASDRRPSPNASRHAHYFLNGKKEPLGRESLESDAPDWCVQTEEEVTTRVLEVQRKYTVDQVRVAPALWLRSSCRSRTMARVSTGWK